MTPQLKSAWEFGLANLVHRTEDDIELVGGRCRGCGMYYFPRSLYCRNPDCTSGEVVEAGFGRAGTLFSWTVQVYKPPPPYRAENWEPYIIGLIDLPEGLRVMGLIVGSDASRIRIGMPLALTSCVLYHDDSGDEVATYAYRPVTPCEQAGDR